MTKVRLKIKTGNLIEEVVHSRMSQKPILKTAIIIQLQGTPDTDIEYKLLWSDDTVSYSLHSYVENMIRNEAWRIHQ